MGAFHRSPAIVPSMGDEVDFFPHILSDICDLQLTGFGVK